MAPRTDILLCFDRLLSGYEINLRRNSNQSARLVKNRIHF
jgi:hypothetical protein